MAFPTAPAPLSRWQARAPSVPLGDRTDEELLALVREGDEDAFRAIHDRYRRPLLSYVRRLLRGRSNEDIEDVVQDIFERAARTLPHEGAVRGLRGWLYSVAHNRCIDEIRRQPPVAPDVFAVSRMPSADTGAVVERRADLEALCCDLRALPEQQRSALLMRELQGLSHDELASSLEITVPAVKSLLVRARMGLVHAEESRQIACSTIREDLASAHEDRVRPSGRATRHLRDCPSCRAYRLELRTTTRRIAALAPGPAFLPLLAFRRLLDGAGAHISLPAAATNIGSGGTALLTAGKVASVLGAAALLTTGAVVATDPLASQSHHAAARVVRDARTAPSLLAAPAAATVATSALHHRPKPATAAETAAAAAVTPLRPHTVRAAARTATASTIPSVAKATVTAGATSTALPIAIKPPIAAPTHAPSAAPHPTASTSTPTASSGTSTSGSPAAAPPAHPVANAVGSVVGTIKNTADQPVNVGGPVGTLPAPTSVTHAVTHTIVALVGTPPSNSKLSKLLNLGS